MGAYGPYRHAIMGRVTSYGSRSGFTIKRKFFEKPKENNYFPFLNYVINNARRTPKGTD